MGKKKTVIVNKRFVWTLGLLAGLTLLGGVAYFYFQQSGSLIVEPTSKNVQNGQLLFNKNCLVCHGPGAIGEDPSQPRGGMKPDGVYLAPALNGTGHAWHHPSKDLFNYIKNGSSAPDSTMKGFKDKLTDQEIKTILQYIQSLWPEDVRKNYGL